MEPCTEYIVLDSFFGPNLPVNIVVNKPSGSFVFEGPLDPYVTNLVGAWSFSRRLLTSYTGPIIRVRRSSDDVEVDIGYTTLGYLNTAELLSFIGSNSGFIVRKYNQTGSGVDYVQSTKSAQLRIVNAGVIEEDSGVPSARGITASNTYMQTTSNMQVRTWASTAKLLTNILYPGLLTGASTILLIGSAAPSQRFVSSFAQHMRYNGVNYAFDGTPFCYPDTGCSGLVITEGTPVNEIYYLGSERNIPGRYFDGYMHETIAYSDYPDFLEDAEGVLMSYLSI